MGHSYNRFVVAAVASMVHIEIHSVDFDFDLRIDSRAADTTMIEATVAVLLVPVKMVSLDFRTHIHFAFVQAAFVVVFDHSLKDHH